MLVDEDGKMHPFRNVLSQTYTNMTRVDELRGAFGVLEGFSVNGAIRLQVYNSNAIQGRLLAGEHTLRIH